MPNEQRRLIQHPVAKLHLDTNIAISVAGVGNHQCRTADMRGRARARARVLPRIIRPHQDNRNSTLVVFDVHGAGINLQQQIDDGLTGTAAKIM